MIGREMTMVSKEQTQRQEQTDPEAGAAVIIRHRDLLPYQPIPYIPLTTSPPYCKELKANVYLHCIVYPFLIIDKLIT